MPAKLSNLPAEVSGISGIGLPPEDPFTIDAALLGAPEDFILEIDVSGWEKVVTRPGGDVIILAPRQEVTLTNLDTGQTFTSNISGSTHQDYQPDGSHTDTYVGRHLNYDPDAGFVLLAGHFTVTYDEDDNPIETLSGTGQIVDVWDYLL